MNNYKIINTHTNEIIKALNELGYVWTPKKFDEQDCLLKAHWILAEQSGAITYSSGTMIDYPLEFQELTLPQLRDLVAQSKSKEQGLISGAEALRALADGKEVNACVTLRPNTEERHWFDAKNLTVNEIEGEETEGMPDGSDVRKIVFRLKPRTIKLEIEIPAPFEPKDDDRVWVLDVHRECGYGPLFFNSAEPKYTHFGAWRTEEEIKQVVAALRGVKG